MERGQFRDKDTLQEKMMHFISKFWFRTTVVILCFALVGLCVIVAEVFLLSSAYKGYPEAAKLVDIPHGTRLVGIADRLAQEGVIRHRRAFVIALALERRRKVIRAGEYSFDRPLSEFEVIRKLLRGEVHYRQVTIPEGSNIFDVADILDRSGLVDKEEFIAAAHRVEPIKDIAPTAVSLEGYLFPDTYRFEKHTPADEIVAKMVERARKVLTPQFAGEAQQVDLTLHQAVILASLIEKETHKESERPMVSAVFLNRLRIHQRLECDPTVIYAALVNNRYRGKIYKSDMQIDSPFNTYLQSGLPLGPIANPGLSSLEAAVHPAKVDYLYFVSDNSGGHIFSRTLAQHQMAVRDYRRGTIQQTSSRNHRDPAPTQRSTPPKRQRSRIPLNP